MPRSNVKVVLRTRPCLLDQSHLVLDKAAKTATINHGGRISLGLPSNADKAGPPQRYQFKFDGLLHAASQEEVFEVCASDMVQQALEGYNGCILCYGQTGAGKTYTMSGNTACYEQRGLIPRVLAALLSSLRTAPGVTSWSLSLSYLEVYNDVLYDLLDINASPSELTLYEEASGQLQVAGARKVAVTNESEALALFFEGETNRVIGQHQLNRESSRSHSVFIAHTTCVHKGAAGTATASKLCLVDLAGSERVAKTRSEGLLLREAGAINKSLALLEQVVLAAAAVGRGAWQHVPYRTCKLTHVLKDCLGGNCATLLIANVWGEAAQLEETLSTCRFASRMAALEVDVSRNTLGGGGTHGSNARVKALQREVQELKEELAMMHVMHTLAAQKQQQQQQQQQDTGQPDGSSSGNAAAGGAADDPYTAYSLAQRQKLRQQVLMWLQQQQQQQQGGDAVTDLQQQQQQGWGGSVAPLPLHNVRQLRELLYAYKSIMQDVLRDRTLSCSSTAAGDAPTSAQGWQADGSNGSSSGQGLGAWPNHQQQQQESDLVGDGDDISESQTHALGAAPDHARPSSYGGISSSAIGDSDDALAADLRPGSLAAAASGPPGGSPWGMTHPGHGMTHPGRGMSHPGSAPAREEALIVFRAGPGAGQAKLVNDNHVRLRGAKKRRQAVAEQLNGLKAQLDGMVQRQECLKQQRLQAAAAAAAAMSDAHASADAGQQQHLSQSVAAAQVMSPEEYQLVSSIRDVKAQYRDLHAELQCVREEVSYTSGLLDTCKAELAASFEDWYASTYGQAALISFSLPASRPDSSFTDVSAAAASSPGYLTPPTGSSSSTDLAAAAAEGLPVGRPRVHSTPGGSPSSSNSSSSSNIHQQQQQQQRRHSSTPPLSSLVGVLGSGSSSSSHGGGYFSAAGSSTTGSYGSIGLPGSGYGHGGSMYGAGRLSSLGGGGILGAVSSSSLGGGFSSMHGLQQQQQQQPEGEAAAAFYEAQQTALLMSRGGRGGGSMKKHRGERGTFSMAGRSSLGSTLQF